VRTDKAVARRLVRQATRYSGEPERLKLVVPSLVTTTGNVYPPAYLAFVRHAPTSASKALHPPAAREVERMVSTLDGADAKTTISTLDNQTADAYLAEAARDTRPLWPSLARVLQQSRDEL
jgi:hypothetical protein